MGSYFREQFGSTFSTVFGAFADPQEWITYTDGAGNSTDLNVIWRAETTELVEDTIGNLIDATVTQVVVPIDSLDGIAEIDWEAVFIRGETSWDIDTREGRGIEAENPTFAVVHLIKRIGITQSPAGRRITS